ncbi:hypothetical protein B0H13DRAFT_2313387 [Mycena leptocephala]|nr:hypothetical protein B0H13DRAFT_2313387 [Mycena leptocephala]
MRSNQRNLPLQARIHLRSLVALDVVAVAVPQLPLPSRRPRMPAPASQTADSPACHQPNQLQAELPPQLASGLGKAQQGGLIRCNFHRKPQHVVMANELASRLAQHTAMASPGPPVRDRLHANSDVEDSSEPDSDEFPLTLRQRAPRVPALRTGSDSDDDTAPPSAAPAPAIYRAAKTTTGVQQPATRGAGRRRRAPTANTQANTDPTDDDDCDF